MRMVFLRRPKKPLAARSTFLCLAWDVTPRLTRDIWISWKARRRSGRRPRMRLERDGGSAVRQEILLDIVAVGLEQHLGAAQIADLLGRPLDHPVALAALGVNHFAGSGDFKALFGARFGLQLGHLALLGV